MTAARRGRREADGAARSVVRGATLAVAAAILLSGAADVAAQEEPPGSLEEDSTELVFQREVFSYPSFQRVDPFRPLLGEEDGPRFEELSLLGVVHASGRGRSVALLASGGGESGRTYRVREGETLGNSRIIEIQESRVIFQVTEFGLTEQRVLELPRPGEGDST